VALAEREPLGAVLRRQPFADARPLGERADHPGDPRILVDRLLVARLDDQLFGLGDDPVDAQAAPAESLGQHMDRAEQVDPRVLVLQQPHRRVGLVGLDDIRTRAMRRALDRRVAGGDGGSRVRVLGCGRNAQAGDCQQPREEGLHGRIRLSLGEHSGATRNGCQASALCRAALGR
jgi:hypothetical protein